MKIQVGKKELSEKQKKILRKVKVILQYVFIFLSLLIATTVAWVFRTWKGLTMEEVVFQIQAPTTGTDSGIISSFILTCPLISIVLTLVILLLHKRLGKIKDIAVLGLMVAFLAVAAFSVGYMWNRLDITAYAKNQTTESTFIEDNYADPKEVDLTFPEKKRNLIYIYLESMEDTYADKKSGGAFEKSRIPELAKLSLENENFSGNSTALNGGIPMYGATWTMGALFAQTSGLPLNLPIRGDLMSTQSEFLPGVINLGDILEENGYKQYFLMGSEAEFAGRDLYYKQHGNYTIYDYNYSLENGEIPEDYHVFWGYEDAKLFEFAKQHLTQISKNNEPFNFSMLTVDTHFEDGYRCKDCPNTFGDDQYANVMACSSKKVTEFVKWIQEQDFYENTTIVISGDHLTMDSNFCDDVPSSYERKVYATYINSAVQPETEDYREYSTMDNFPTTLASLGVEISGNRLGLGTNLFSSEETLIETYGKEQVNTGLKMKSKFMDELTKDIIVENAKKVQEEEKAEAEEKKITADITVSDYDALSDSFKVSLSKVKCQLPVESIQCTVWKSDGMKALVWYEAEKQEDGTYSIEVKGSDLAHEEGSYDVIVYGQAEGYDPSVIKTVTGEIKEPESKITADVTVTNYDFRKGYFDVILSNVESTEPVTAIECTVWEKDGTVALKTYQAKRQGDGTYLLRIKAMDFYYKTGTYRILIYGQTENSPMMQMDEVFGEITG